MRTYHLSESFLDFTVKSVDAHVFRFVCLFLQPRTDAEGHTETPNHLVSVAKNMKTSWHDWSKHQSEKPGCYSGRQRSEKNQSGANLEKPTQEHNENNLLAPQKRNQHPPVWWLFPCSIISTSPALRKPEPFSAHLLWSHHVQDTRRHHSSHWDSRNVLNAEYRWLQFSPPLFHWTHLSIRSTVPQRDTS